MVINSLNEYYELLKSDANTDIALYGYSREKVNFVLLINIEGDLVDIIDLKEDKRVPEFIVPQHFKRTSGKNPYFLCDNSKYFLGYEEVIKPKECCFSLCSDCKNFLGSKFDYFQLSSKYHIEILKDVVHPVAQVLVKFFLNWYTELFSSNEIVFVNKEKLDKDGNIVFRVEGCNSYVHEIPEIKKAWETYFFSKNSERIIGQCLVTGELSNLKKVHDSVKGVKDAKTTGAAIVSFNIESFRSYGKDQSINSPISETVAFNYITALNYILRKDSTQKIQIGDATTVFWADKLNTGEELLLFALINPSYFEKKDEKDEMEKNENTKIIDQSTATRVRDFLARFSKGKFIENYEFDKNVNFSILGLSPNSSRIFVRFYFKNTFRNFLGMIEKHFEDVKIEKQYENQTDFISLWQFLNESAFQAKAQSKAQKVNSSLTGNLLKAFLFGSRYPYDLYSAILARIKVDSKINYIRVSYIKAYLKRSGKLIGGEFMSLDNDQKNVGYLMGRLFAILEKTQRDVSPNLESTIRDRYFGIASSAPKTIFPLLLKLNRHHISENKYARRIEMLITEVMANLDNFPSFLNADEQGMFMLGYYHQMNDFYRKKEKEQIMEVYNG